MRSELKKIYFPKNIAKIGKVTKFTIIVQKSVPLFYFGFILVQTVILPIMKVPQIFKIFFPQYFFLFINKRGRYYDIDDSKRLVLEIAHVFIGTILRLNSFGQPILVLKTVLSDKTFKYTSVAKTPISTEFVEYC